MIALRIEEQKKFTSGLFIGELFDQFLLREADIVTFNRFTIDGRVRRGYYTGEEQEEGKIGEFSSWRTIKPVAYGITIILYHLLFLSLRRRNKNTTTRYTDTSRKSSWLFQRPVSRQVPAQKTL